MARTAQVRHFATKNGFFYTPPGKNRIRLATGPDDSPDGPTYKAALAAYLKLVCTDDAAPPPAADSTMYDCVSRYLAHLERNTSEGHVESSNTVLRNGLKVWGQRMASTIKRKDVTAWLEGMTTWGASTRHTAWARLKGCLTWNTAEGHLSADPLEKVSSPDCAREKVARGAEYAIHPDLLKLMIEVANPDLSDLLVVLARTGARPSEIALAEVKHYVREDKCIVLTKWKNARKTKKERVIHLDPTCVQIIESRIAEAGGEGRIFWSLKGCPWTGPLLKDTWGQFRRRPRIKKWLKDHGVNHRHVIMYSLRHRYATQALLKGVSIKLLADLLGTSVSMIESNYAHCVNERQAMRQVYLSLLD